MQNNKDEQLLQKIERRVDSNLPVRDDLLNDLADLQATPDAQFIDELEARLLALAYQQHGENTMQKMKNKGNFSLRRFRIPATFTAVITLVIVGLGVAGLLVANQNRINNEFVAPVEQLPPAGAETSTPIPTPTVIPTVPPNGGMGNAGALDGNPDQALILIIRNDDTPLHNAASENSPIITSLAQDTLAYLIEPSANGRWVYVAIEGLPRGWLQSVDVVPVTSRYNGQATEAHFVAPTVAYVYENPDLNSSVIRVLSQGTGVQVLVNDDQETSQGYWQHVVLADGTIGWMLADSLQTLEGDVAPNVMNLQPTRVADPFEITATAVVHMATQYAHLNTSAQAINVTATPGAIVQVSTATPFPTSVFTSTPIPSDIRFDTFNLSSNRIVFHDELAIQEGDEVQIFAAVLLADWEAVGSFDVADIDLEDLLETSTPLLTIDRPAHVERMVSNPDGSTQYVFNVTNWDKAILDWVNNTDIPFILVVLSEEEARALQDQS